MATLGSKLIVKEMNLMANMTEENHLGMALMLKPTKLEGVMNTLFSAEYYYSDNPLSSMLMGKSVTEVTIDNTEWEWDLKASSCRPLVVMENVEPPSVTQLGKFLTSFRIKLDENFFLPGDVIVPASGNKKYQVRIIDYPVKHGDGWVYEVRLMTDDPQFFLPAVYLDPGTRWSKMYSVYGEGADRGGSTQFSTFIRLRNKMTKLRKQYRVTDYASTAVLAIGIPGSDGKIYSSWIKYAEVEYWRQWYREIERAIWYGRSTDTVLDSTGRPVRSGPGIQEQLEDSHVHYYTHLTSRLLEEYLMDIFYGRIKPGSGRKVVAYTGEYGMIIFHRAMTEWVDKNGFLKNIEPFMNKTTSEYHPNAIEVGYKIVRYNMANGATIDLVHNPLYDDIEINSEIDPITGYPIESMRFTFLDFTSADGFSSNVRLYNKRQGYSFAYVNGLYGPYGPVNGGNASHSGEYYEMHVSKTFGVHIHDVTRCGELILKRA